MGFLTRQEIEQKINGCHTYALKESIKELKVELELLDELRAKIISKIDSVDAQLSDVYEKKYYWQKILDNYEIYSSDDYQDFLDFRNWLNNYWGVAAEVCDSYGSVFDYRNEMFRRFLNGERVRDLVDDDEFDELFKKYKSDKK